MAEMNTYSDDIRQIFDQDLPWGKLSGSNILITGATGLIGSTLVDVLMSNPRRDYDVYASGRNVERAKQRFGKYFDFQRILQSEPGLFLNGIFCINL